MKAMIRAAVTCARHGADDAYIKSVPGFPQSIVEDVPMFRLCVFPGRLLSLVEGIRARRMPK